MTFADHFSRLAKTYARYRPQYPPELFAYLASISPALDLAWDCGTGSGQAALQLAQHFAHVHATDASREQIAEAQAHERVSYHIEQAESVSLDTGSVDLVTVAVAVHWFDFDKFYTEVRRVLKPGGVLAVWAYHIPSVDPGIDRMTWRYYQEVLEGYWSERIRYLDDRYRSLPFPFLELEPPSFDMRTSWNLDQFAGFLGSWSAAQKYLDTHGAHPLEVIWSELEQAWGEPDLERELSWPLYMRIGRAA